MSLKSRFNMAGLAVCFVLGACAQVETLPDCPNLKVAKDTSFARYFEKGSDQKEKDLLFELEVASVMGSCEYAKDLKNVELSFALEVDAVKGQALKGNKASFDYFVAIPKYYPKSYGKQVFPVHFKFPENRNYLRYKDEEVIMNIPLEKGIDGENLDVYVGLQLDEKQLEHNRNK